MPNFIFGGSADKHKPLVKPKTALWFLYSVGIRFMFFLFTFSISAFYKLIISAFKQQFSVQYLQLTSIFRSMSRVRNIHNSCV